LIRYGQAYFDLTSLPLDTPIMTATLRLYTPAQTTATGVQVYPNAPSVAFDPTMPPSWASAPAISGTTGIVQNGSDGHWQSWDVTSLVQQWVGDNTTNAGLTLVGNGTPLRFASTLGAGTDAATLAPYLDITYDPRPAARGQNYYDGARTIYGISGSFGEDFDKCFLNRPCDNGLTPYPVVKNQLGGAFVRFGAILNCQYDNPQQGHNVQWWENTSGFVLDEPTHANLGDDVDIVTLVRRAYQAGLIPIVNFLLPNGDVGCRNLYSPDYGYHTNKLDPVTYQQHWANQMQDFVQTLTNVVGPYLTLHTYFEVGNEQNNNDPAYYGPDRPGDAFPNGLYPPLFAAAAKGLQDALGGIGRQLDNAGRSQYTILTSGVTNPAVNDSVKDPSSNANPPARNSATPYPTSNNHRIMTAAVAAAVTQGVQPSRLGFAVHPYHYTTYGRNYSSTSGFWRNFYNEYGFPLLHFGNQIAHNGYVASNDLSDMINLWTHYSISHKFKAPVVFTEDNWSNEISQPIDIGNNQYCSNITGCEGTYLADLFTWLSDNGYAVSGADATNSIPIRVGWYRGADRFNDLNGLYDAGGQSKHFVVHTCRSTQSNFDTDHTDAAGQSLGNNASMVNYYNELRYSACY